MSVAAEQFHVAAIETAQDALSIEFRSKIQPGSSKGSEMSVQSIGCTWRGIGPAFSELNALGSLPRLTAAARCVDNVAAVIYSIPERQN